MAFTLNHPLSAGANWCIGGDTRNVRFSPRHSFLTPFRTRCRRSAFHIARAKASAVGDDQQSKKSKDLVQSSIEEEEEVEEELPWIQEKALDLVEFTGTVTQAIPGPRVGQSPLPWMLAVPLAYIGLTFVFAVFKTVKKFTSPRAKRKKLTGFNMDDILRKYIRYVLNERPFNPDTVAGLVHLRKASMLEDHQVAEVLNETSRRIVKEKGPVVMDISGFTEKGFKRKLAVQALFGKVFYLSEIPEFCARDNSLVIKEIFGVTDDDADTLRLHTLSESGDIETLEKLVDDADSEEPDDDSVRVV